MIHVCSNVDFWNKDIHLKDLNKETDWNLHINYSNNAPTLMIK